MSKKNEPISKRDWQVLTIKEGVTLIGRISPCVWMYPGYPLQLTVKIDGATDNTIVSDSSTGINFQSATPEAMQALIETVKVCECSKCKSPTFTVLCQRCQREDFDARWAEEEALEQVKEAKRLQQAKVEGYTHRVIAWIHPEDGDDRMVEILFKGAPTAKGIKAQLHRLGSVVDDDYQITEL